MVGNWRQMRGESSPLMVRLRSQGYAISEYRSDDYLQVYALTKNGASRYLYLLNLNSPEISPTGEQRTLTLINNQGDLSESQIEELAQSSTPSASS